MRKKLLLIISLILFVFQNNLLSAQKTDTKTSGDTKPAGEFSMSAIQNLYKTRSFDKVKEKLEAWMDKSPETFPAEGFLLLGNVYDHLKMFAAAIKVYEKGLLTAKNTFPYYINIAQVYRHMQDHKKSLEILEKIKDRGFSYPEIYLFQGMSYFELKDKVNTITSWENYISYKAPGGEKYEKVKKAIAYLRGKDFKWPDEQKKDKEDQNEELKKFLKDLKETITKEKTKELEQDPVVKEEKLEVKDKGKQEGEKFDEIER